jgi:GMP synthase-like glutamine amidotransferase
MIRLAYLENGASRDDTSELSGQMAALGAKLERFWAFGDDFPTEIASFDGFILSGSPLSSYDNHDFIIREHSFIRTVADAGIPMLGLCFGSQILASALCGRDQVFRRSRCEVGYAPLPLSDAARSDAMTGQCPPLVEMFVWHNDEVRADHPDMTILASSDQCPNQIWRYRDKPFWGIQGHPEITRDQAPVWFEENRDRMTQDGADVEQLKRSADEAAEAKTMLTRFVEHVQRG